MANRKPIVFDTTNYIYEQLVNTDTLVTGDVNVTGNITLTGTVDGRNLETDGTKLDGIEAGAEVNTVTSVNGQTGAVTVTAGGADLTYTASTRLLESSSGTDVTLPEVTAGGDSGLMTGADKTKLNGIATGAIAEVLSDTTPQLGGNLDLNSNDITGTGDIDLTGSIAGTSLSTGAAGTGINVSTTTITGPSTMTIDPAVIGNNTGTLVIAGNLQVDGTTTTINSTELTVDDKLITLASGASTAAEANGGGMILDGASASITYSSSNDRWNLNKGVDVTGNITLSGTVDGRDIATDGTKLDGIESGAEVNTVTSVNGQTGAVTVAGSTDLSYTASTRVLASSTGTDVTLPEVVAAGDSGLMTGADKTKLNGIAAGAEVNVGTDLSYALLTRTLSSSTGADVSLPLATGSNDGLITSSNLTKLNGIETGATADQTAAEILTEIKTVDGSGSGLDADLLDGVEGSNYLRSDISDTTNGNITISSNGPQLIFSESDTTTGARLIVSGGDLYIQAGASGSGNSTSSGDIRITGYNADNINAFTVKSGGSDNTIWHAGNDGSGSGLDADTLDGIEGGNFLRSNVTDIATGAIQWVGTLDTFDAPGSGEGVGTDTATDVAIALGTGHRIAGYASGYIRSLLEWNTGSAITIGQGATSMITEINLMPGANGAAKVNSNTIWHAGNDGSGSGLDADTIDGINSLNIGRRVVQTANGSTGTENGANTWVKIATFSTGTSQYVDCCLILAITNQATSQQDSAIISAFFRSNSTNANPSVAVEILANGGGGGYIQDDSFKMISGGWSTDMELWAKKSNNYGGYAVYEISKRQGGGTLTYNDNAAWQSATPTGTVNNVVSDGLTFRNNTVWHGGNDGSGSGLDADTLDGVEGGNFLRSNVDDTATGDITFSGAVSAGTVTYSLLNYGPTTSTRDKIRVYPSSSYAIGMQSGISFGGLNDWGMTFQFNNEDDRGFWWGDTGHTQAQGAMALTTNGKLSVAHSLRIGYGESDTTIPGATHRLDVSGSILATNDITAFSDISLKSDIQTIPDAIDKILKIRGVTYVRNDLEDKSRKCGVIAQEVEEVLPEVVSTTEDGTKTVAYGNLVGLLIESIKELKTEIETLKKQIEK